MVIAALLPLEDKSPLRLAAFLVPYGIIGWDILWKAIRNIKNGQVFDENFLMAVATIGALAVKEYPEASAVMLFYQTDHLMVFKDKMSVSCYQVIRINSKSVLNVEEKTELIMFI